MSPRSLLGVAGATLVLVAAVLWGYPSSTDFAVSNPSWNGLRQAARELRIAALPALRDLPRQPRGSVLVVIPATPLSTDDLGLLERFVRDGGVVVLLDDFGFGNDVLAHLGLRVRLSGRMLHDALLNHKNRRLPRITDIQPGPATAGVESLILNHATAIIDAAAETTVLARSSPIAYLDANGNGRRDPDEGAGAFIVAAATPIGLGHLVLVADSSLLLNSMLALGDNRRFALNLLRLAGEGAQVYVEASHLPRAPLDVAKTGLAQARAALAHPLAISIILGVALSLPVTARHRLTRR